jgi:hypothetical protein
VNWENAVSQRISIAVVCAALAGIVAANGTVAAAATTNSGSAITAVAKPAGYKIVTKHFTAPSGADTAGSVACPKFKGAQTVPLSGGAKVNGPSLETNINSSWPTAKGWDVRVNNASATAATVIVYAVCAKKLSGYVQEQSASVTNPAGSQSGAGFGCPSGEQLLGGGALSSSRSTLVNLNSSWPGGMTLVWNIDMDNASSASAAFNVYALCANLNVVGTNYQLAGGTPVANPPGIQTAASATCPGGLSALGGGVVSTSSATDVTINATFPFTGGWSGDENNAGAGSEFVTAFVLCAS